LDKEHNEAIVGRCHDAKGAAADADLAQNAILWSTSYHMSLSNGIAAKARVKRPSEGSH
jgi:hypothetical protein